MSEIAVEIQDSSWITNHPHWSVIAGSNEASLGSELGIAQSIGTPFLEAVTRPLQGRVFAVATDSDRTLCGLTWYDDLPWDSEIYGRKMAVVGPVLAACRLEQRRSMALQLVARLLRHATERGVNHLTARIRASDFPAIHAFEDSGFRTMGVQVTMGCESKQASVVKPIETNGVTVRPCVDRDVPHLQELSADAYPESRFYADPSLPVDATRQLHRLWIRNDCEGRAAKVFVAELAGHPVGYVACLLHPQEEEARSCAGVIDLLAVAPAARGRGIGITLLSAAVQWLKTRTAQIIVKTQVTNIRAIALYQKFGLRPIEAQTILHKSIG